MTQPRQLDGYLSALAAQLPAPVVAELADGLGETHEHYLRQGLDPDAAARAAVREFGEPSQIIAGFADVTPARRVARLLMRTGPLVGACWTTALITGRAWAWPVQPAAVALAGLVLLATIGLILSAASGPRYRSVVRAGVAGCLGVTVIDAFLVITVPLTAPSLSWITSLALAASLTRLLFSAHGLRWCLADAGLRPGQGSPSA
jgi:hypothetical protein